MLLYTNEHENEQNYGLKNPNFVAIKFDKLYKKIMNDEYDEHENEQNYVLNNLFYILGYHYCEIINETANINNELIEKIKSKLPVDQLLKTEFKKPTLQLWAALFMAFAALYFLTSWIPKLAKDAGLSMELAIYAGTVFNIGAFFGIITQGYFSSKYGLKKTLGVILVLTGVLMASFGLFVGSDVILLILALLGFGIQGGFVGLYALSARLYPTEFRTTGVGWAMGAGRLGGIVGPMIGGLLIGAGLGIATNFLIFAVPALLSGLITAKIDSKEIS